MSVFHENWFGEASQEAVEGLVKMTSHLDGNVVEVGCWEGRSTLAIARACRPAVVHAVDTWQGSPGEISSHLAGERDVLATFLANTDGHNIDAYIMDWRTYFADHAGPTRFLHIDGEHTYEQVADNIDAALPHMVAGGVICGDDVHHPPVQQAVLERFPGALSVATLWWTFV